MRLFQLEKIDSNISDSLPKWVNECCKEFIKMIISINPQFPCYFAPISHYHNSIFYTYIEKSELSSPKNFVFDITEYLSKAKQIKHYTALVVFIETELLNQPLSYYEDCFWRLLQFIHDNDSHSWNENIVRDTSSTNWIFYFNDTPVFINGHSSAYKFRKSRYAPTDLMLIIQPYENISKLEQHSNIIQQISDKIRGYISKYDKVPVSEVFGKNFADSNTLNWKQFWLTESEDNIHNTNCPLKIK